MSYHGFGYGGLAVRIVGRNLVLVCYEPRRVFRCIILKVRVHVSEMAGGYHGDKPYPSLPHGALAQCFVGCRSGVLPRFHPDGRPKNRGFCLLVVGV